MNKLEQPTILKIKKIIDEADDFKTFIFDYDLKALPGQYVMVWIPGVDLKPFSVAWQKDGQFALTVLKIGPFTQELFKLKRDDQIGIQGPYGTFYNYQNKQKILLVGGGSGTPSVAFLAQKAKEDGLEMDFVLAAKSQGQIIYEDWLKNPGVNVYHRFEKENQKEHSLDIITDLVEKNNYDGIYACGPEGLLKKLVDLSIEKDIFCQISMERYMKCGIGICGQCCVDDLGICICKQGPVVTSQLANKIKEFGKYHRDKTGTKKYF